MRASDGEREKKGEGFGSERLTALLVQVGIVKRPKPNH